MLHVSWHQWYFISQPSDSLLLSDTCQVEKKCKAYKFITLQPLLTTLLTFQRPLLPRLERLFATTVWVKKSPLRFSDIFSQTVGNFESKFYTPIIRSYLIIYARVQIFIQLPTTLTKLHHIKCNHRVHIMCSKCPPSAEMHAMSACAICRRRIFYPLIEIN